MDTPLRAEHAPVLFSEASAQWLDWKRATLKNSSLVRYNSILSLYLLPAFGRVPIGDISRQDAARFAQGLLGNGSAGTGGLSPASAAVVLSVLKSIFQYTRQIQDIPVADLHGITVKQPYRPLRVFTRSEQQRLSHYLLMRRDPTSVGIVLALNTGLRAGELCALRWQDISLSERSLNVRHTMQRLPAADDFHKTAVMITAPKSPSSLRTIPLPEVITDMLREIKANDSCFVLSGTEAYIEPRCLENRFKSALRICGIAPAGFHACRHSFATRCIELGFDVKSLSEILGHASVNITMNRYVHPSMEFKRENMNRLEELIK